MKTEYDIIVVGAGPAGSMTARVAAENNASVLLLEKRPEIGVPKRCGEGLSADGVATSGLIPDKEWCRQEITGARVYAPSGKFVEVRYPKIMGYVIERKSFDKKLAILAAEKGADVYSGARVSGLIKDASEAELPRISRSARDGNTINGVKVVTRSGNFEIKCKVLIAADGMESLIARWAGINSAHTLADTCSGAQFEMTNVSLKDQLTLEIYMGNQIAPGGYIWIFPKGKNSANVGIGVRANMNSNAYALLQKFVDSRPDLKGGSIVEINGGGIPVGKPLETLVANGFMVVGDAAHQVNAIHGGGVHESMKAAKIAGEVAAKCAKKDDCSKEALSEYPQRWIETGGKKLARLVKLRKVLESLSDSDLDFLANQLTGEDIINLTGAEKFTIFTKIFAKRPSLLKFIPMLLG